MNISPLSPEAKKNFQIIQSSVRVDVVQMPKMTLQELKKMQNVPVQKSAPVKKAEAKVDTTPAKKGDFLVKKKKTNFLSMLKGLSKRKTKTVKGTSTGTQADEGLDLGDRKRLKQLVLAGNKKRMGNAIVGDAQTVDQSALASYVGQLPALVKPYWKLPSYLLEQDLRCRIRIYLNRNGDLIRTEIYESSGNSDYDGRAKNAIEKAAPFPAAPSELQAAVYRGTVLLGFPL